MVTVLNVHMLLNSQCKDFPPPMYLMGLNQLPCLGRTWALHLHTNEGPHWRAHPWGQNLEVQASASPHTKKRASLGEILIRKMQAQYERREHDQSLPVLPAWPCPHLLGVKNPRLENRSSTCPGQPLWEDASSSSPAGAPPPLLQSPGCWVARPLLLETAGSTPKTRFTWKIADP